MHVPRSFVALGTDWQTIGAISEENKLFRWQRVVVKWSGRGPRPTFATEERVFFMCRQRKSDGHWIGGF